jgi:hypothetical protein
MLVAVSCGIHPGQPGQGASGELGWQEDAMKDAVPSGPAAEPGAQAERATAALHLLLPARLDLRWAS